MNTLKKISNKRSSDPIERLIFEKGLRIATVITDKKLDILLCILNNSKVLRITLSDYKKLRGETGTVIDNQQGSYIEGHGNTTNQTIKNKVLNKQKGYGGGDTGTSLTNGQGSEVVGNGNTTNQLIKNKVKNKIKPLFFKDTDITNEIILFMV